MVIREQRFSFNQVRQVPGGVLDHDRHAKCVDSLCDATLGVLRSASLAVCTIGQGLAAAHGLNPKHATKQVDRLLYNPMINVDEILVRWVPYVVGLVLCLVLVACGTPISVERVDARTVQTELSSNALTTGQLSESTEIALRRLDLLRVYTENPSAGIQALDLVAAANTGDRNLLFALAEMAFQEAERTRDRSYFLATAVYVYACSCLSRRSSDWLCPVPRRRLVLAEAA
jgi:hypothetical protein